MQHQHQKMHEDWDGKRKKCKWERSERKMKDFKTKKMCEDQDNERKKNELTRKQKGSKKMWGAGWWKRKKCKQEGREIVKGKRMNEHSKPKINNLNTKRWGRTPTCKGPKKRHYILNVKCVLGHKWTKRWGDDEKKKTDAKSKKGRWEVKNKIDTLQFFDPNPWPTDFERDLKSRRTYTQALLLYICLSSW